MKKAIFLVVLGVNSLCLSAQESKTWRLGLQWGAHDNLSKYSGGSPNANARFTQNKYNGGAFDLIARYDYNNHWMAETGLGFNTFGFGFALAENYSLSNFTNRFSSINTVYNGVEIPFMVFYKFNPNCKNNRWLIGGGFVANFTQGKSVSKFYEKSNDGITSSNYLSSTSNSNNGGHSMLRFSVGREKMFKRGSFLNASLVFNAGLNTIAKAKVNYTVDGTNYSHEFTNNGNFVGVRFAYFFKPLTSFTKKPSPAKPVSKIN